MIYDAETLDVEVTHREHGRGRIVDVAIGRRHEVDVASVYFYMIDEAIEVPLTALSPASAMTTVDVVEGTHGFEIMIDDGFFKFVITPDGEGNGFDISMKAGKADVDTHHLSYEDFL